MIKRKLLFVLVILILTFFFFWDNDSNGNLKDNYYQTINYDILSNVSLEDDEYSWSHFIETQDKVDKDIDKIVDDILNGENKYLDSAQVEVINDIYSKTIDVDRRNNEGIKALVPYINRVWNVSTVEELIDSIVIIEQELGLDILTNIEVMADYKDNDNNIVYFTPVTFAFGVNSDYIINEDYMTYKAYIKRACVRLWRAYGKDAKESREIVNRVFSFYEKIAGNSKSISELENIINYYNLISEDDFYNIFTNINNDYLLSKGIDSRNIYSIVDRDQYQYLNNSLSIDNLQVWKELIVTKILSSYASYGSLEYVLIVEDLNEALLGKLEDNSDKRRAIDLVKELFSSELDYIYDKEFLIESQKQEIEDMFLELKDVYKERLRNNKWLSKSAKDTAILKLDMMDIIIGYDNSISKYNVSNDLSVSDSGLIEDIIDIQQNLWDKELELLDNDGKIDLVSQSVVNAYYQPLDNSIIIPVSFLSLIDEDGNYYNKLGTMGMILAHEITHAFDCNGAQFDENGNLNNWWDNQDVKNFNLLKDKVSNYYNKYEVLDGKYINGEKTVNENIADLGALSCISEVALNKDASDDEIREMFSSFASIWSSYESKEYMELLLLQDVHSPNEFRVNAVLSSNDLFYRVYDIYPWNNMWISRDNRVSVW